MSNYSPPVLRAKLTGLVHMSDIGVCTLLIRAVVSRLSVSQVVGSAATARARFTAHALSFNRQAFLRVSLATPGCGGSA